MRPDKLIKNVLPNFYRRLNLNEKYNFVNAFTPRIFGLSTIKLGQVDHIL